MCIAPSLFLLHVTKGDSQYIVILIPSCIIVFDMFYNFIVEHKVSDGSGGYKILSSLKETFFHYLKTRFVFHLGSSLTYFMLILRRQNIYERMIRNIEHLLNDDHFDEFGKVNDDKVEEMKFYDFNYRIILALIAMNLRLVDIDRVIRPLFIIQ